MLRQLFVLTVVAVVAWLIRRLFGRPAPRAPRPAPPGRARDEGRLVRDRFCNTFLPQSRALTAQLDGTEYFFCSDRCRKGFLARH